MQKKSLLETASQVQEFVTYFSRSWEEAKRSGATRLHVSVFVAQESLPHLREIQKDWPIIEAITPLSQNAKNTQGLYWLQCGINTEERGFVGALSHGKVPQQLNEISQELRWSFEQATSRVPDGYQLEVLHKGRISEQDLEDLAGVWQRFGYSAQAVETLLFSESNSVEVARYEGRIVSTARLEETIFVQAGKRFVCAEHTDAATLHEHEGKGLYAALLARVQKRRATAANIPDIMYGLCNADQPAVARLGHRLGRRFALRDGEHLGFSGSGILPADSKIALQDGKAEFRDLIFSYHTPESLLFWLAGSRQLR